MSVWRTPGRDSTRSRWTGWDTLGGLHSTLVLAWIIHEGDSLVVRPLDLLSPRLAAAPLSSNCGPLPRGGGEGRRHSRHAALFILIPLPQWGRGQGEGVRCSRTIRASATVRPGSDVPPASNLGLE